MKNKARFILLLFILGSCKYEDGPLISFVSLKDRVAGTYSVESINENGIDKTYIADSLSIKNLTFNWITNDPWGPHGTYVATFADTISTISWHFGSNNNSLDIQGNFGCGIFPFYPTNYEPIPGFLPEDACNIVLTFSWKIKKLTNSKLWLNIVYNDKNVEIHLNKN